MTQDFHDPEGVRQWDSNPVRLNPTRPEQLDLLVSILADAYQAGDTILDLGFGSGIVEALIFERIPQARIIGVDFSPTMMALAHERLKPYADQYRAIEHNLAELDTLALEPCRFIISIQALHHLTDAQMQAAYRRIVDLLAPGGLFLLLDRMAAEPPNLFEVYQSVWRWQDRRYGSHLAQDEGDSYPVHVHNNRERGDLPLSLPRHLELMDSVGLKAACLHLIGLRALIAATKS
ncbi:MAG TPA: class I SAM-dependent methyltransferase [Phototrophicaceae bacterium]|nr:class I SAM-dependent methyltransferase [Phototrophicaceae bacterium]